MLSHYTRKDQKPTTMKYAKTLLIAVCLTVAPVNAQLSDEASLAMQEAISGALRCDNHDSAQMNVPYGSREMSFVVQCKGVEATKHPTPPPPEPHWSVPFQGPVNVIGWALVLFAFAAILAVILPNFRRPPADNYPRKDPTL